MRDEWGAERTFSRALKPLAASQAHPKSPPHPAYSPGARLSSRNDSTGYAAL